MNKIQKAAKPLHESMKQAGLIEGDANEGCSPTTCSAQKSDTPETDAAFVKYNTPPYIYGTVELRIEMERLERERDEARKECIYWRNEQAKYSLWPDYNLRHPFPWEERAEVESQNA